MSDIFAVTALLEKHPEWIEGNGSADPVYVNQYDGSDAEAAALVWAFAMRAPYPNPVDRVFRTFGDGSHFVRENTGQALGLIADDVVPPSRPRALTTEDAVEYLRQGWHLDGSGTFLDLSTEAGRATMARREAFAANVPPSWAGIDPLFYFLFVLRGDIESGVPDLGSRPYAPSPGLRGIAFQSYLDRINGGAGRAKKVLG